MRHTYHSEQWLPYPVDLVFAFFANPENLPRLMPPWQKARIEEAVFLPPPPPPFVPGSPLRPKSIAAGSGTRLILSFRPFPYSPIRIPWEAEISEFVWNDHFCDSQLRGPFAYWRHCHSLSAVASAKASTQPIQGALLRDEVEYELPFGSLGKIAHHLFIKHQLEKTFAYRHARTLELLPLIASRP